MRGLATKLFFNLHRGIRDYLLADNNADSDCAVFIRTLLTRREKITYTKAQRYSHTMRAAYEDLNSLTKTSNLASRTNAFYTIFFIRTSKLR